MYLSSARFDRKSRERSAAPTSLIIVRSRHPFLDGFAWCCGVVIDLRFHLMLSLSRWFRSAAFFTAPPAAREVYGGLVLVWDVILGEGRQRRVFYNV
jgi:hypothetical protein